mmetsp:Transcript_14785/g.30305  ORF Transcript_14785/g.30305 Transcript_14785/m.30305 type:complete len:478 (-) Transcript_14785:28-1461(-)
MNHALGNAQASPPASNDGGDSEESQLELALEMSKRHAQVEQSEAQTYNEQFARAIEASDRLYSNDKDREDAHEMFYADALESSREHAAEAEFADAVMRRKRQRTSDSNAGSWDCPACTFTNRPYRPKCDMCGGRPGPHVLTFRDIGKLRFGAEIEIIIPNGKEDGFDLKSIAKDLTRLGTAVTFCGYNKQTSEQWKLVTDASIRGESSKDLCFELVSPVLCGDGPDGLGSLRLIMENVRRLGVATNTSCGFHVHVDATLAEGQAIPEMASLKGLARVAQCFVSLENAFDLLVTLTWSEETQSNGRRTNRNRYCRSNRYSFGADSNRQRWGKIGSANSLHRLVGLINPNNDRYMKLNMTNITSSSRPSTVEFRHHGGVEDLAEVEAWVRLILRFCERASQRCAESGACLLHERAGALDELKALFALVDCEGLEQFFVTDRKLFGERRLKNEWQCRRCGRSFLSSRSLSQHVEATRHFH